MLQGTLARVAVCAGLVLLATGCGREALPASPSQVGAVVPAAPPAPALPPAPVPTPGARIRVANVGDYDLFTWLVLPRETIHFREVKSNSVSEYIATEHGADEGVGFGFFIGDAGVPPFAGRERPPSSPLGGYAFTYYVRVDMGSPDVFPFVRILRITRDE